jgi:hypothetical protein
MRCAPQSGRIRFHYGHGGKQRDRHHYARFRDRKEAREKGVLFHTDAVRPRPHPLDAAEMNVDLMSISGHKFKGPKGTGALYMRKALRLSPYLHAAARSGASVPELKMWPAL